MTMTDSLPRLSLAAQALAIRDDRGNPGHETPRPCPAEPRPSPLLPISYVRGRAWFVALASPVAMRWTGEHFPAERAIEELRFETYVPRETRKVIRRGRRVDRISALLGGYIFVRFDRERDDWGEIRGRDERGPGGIEGVHGILRDALRQPIRALDIEVARLKRLEAAGAFDFTGGQSNLKPGDDVRVTEGAFLHLIGKIRVANHRKKLELIMGNLVVKIDPEFVEKV